MNALVKLEGAVDVFWKAELAQFVNAGTVQL